MKITILVLSLLTLSSAAFAGRPCPEGARERILKGLERMSTDRHQTEEKQEEALYAISVIDHARDVMCTYISGVAGNNYELLMPTHQIQVDFLGGKVSKLMIKRVRFQ